MQVSVSVNVTPEIGDIVYLNSDFVQSTPMTIEAIYACEECPDVSVDVVWADYGEIKRDSFDLALLVFDEADDE